MSSETSALMRPPQEDLDRSIPLGITILFAFSSFLSAFLLFQVQLIVSKYILPWFGGSAAVWTTSMLVFQLLLLAGYLYSHIVSTRLSPSVQTKLHIGLLGAAFLLIIALSFIWPSAITPGTGWKPLENSSPARDVAVIILVCSGIPFFVLSTTGPLLQSWFARLGGDTRTYKLYSVSNLGSLLGLLTFPFLIEPTLRMKHQGVLWSILFCVFVSGGVLCAVRALEADHHEVEKPVANLVRTETSPFAYSLWFLLAACASALLLASTNLLCQEVTTVPLLWVLPLSLYLLTFILCFDHPRWYKRAIFHPLFAVTLFLTCASLAFERPFAQMLALPGLLFLACMICHGELVGLKPGLRQLTSFYLTISAGGAAGGIFVGVIAPRIFTSFAEYQLSLVLCVILILVTLIFDRNSWIFRSDILRPVMITVGAMIAGYAGARWMPEIAKLLEDLRFYPVVLLVGIIVGMGAFIMKSAGPVENRGFRFVQIQVACVALLAFAALYRSAQPRPGLYLSARSFYGIVRVFRQQGAAALMHGMTVHGLQLDPPDDRIPTAYYGVDSGIGVVLRNNPKRSVEPGTLRIGVVGLGVGTLAAYGHPGDYIRYYEIDPNVVKLSSGPQPVFTYIRDSAAQISIKLGDARLSLEQEAAKGERQRFDVLVLDAFSGDAIPVHLLTKEAFETYWQHLDPEGGIVAVHITSKHVNLMPVLQGVSEHFKTESRITCNMGDGPVFSSCWVLLSHRSDLSTIPGLQQITGRMNQDISPRLWTDDYSDIFRIIF